MRLILSLLICGVVVLPSRQAVADNEADSRAIVLHAIIEAPVDDVWSALVNPGTAARWLWQQAPVWEARTGGRFAVVMHGGYDVTGRVFKAQENEKITLTWPNPATMISIEVKALDDYLTMVTLSHEGFTPKVPAAIEQMNELRLRWVVAMTRLHQQFPPPVVDTRYHRPNDAKGLFIERSLIINGDFHYTAEPGRYEGIAFGWETNAARSTPETHRIAADAGHIRPPAQVIARPPDWTTFAVQQFTSHLVPMIEPGKRYRLTGWVKTEGIRNPAGWYSLGLWCTDATGRPIGEPVKNEKLLDDEGNTRVNHDWHRFAIEGTAPPGAARAVVILSGHWDDAGTVWYDDIQLWQVETPTTRRTPD